MADLSFIQDTGVVNLIDKAYEAARQPRRHLGLSQCGHPCKRWLVYCHQGHAGEQPGGRVLRLFSLGDAIETEIINGLRLAGFSLTDQQKEVVFTQDGVALRGHIDGLLSGLPESSKPHLFEAKSSNDKRFKELLKLGSYEDWDEKYSFQVQAYMLGLNLTRAAVFVYNKNTSELYYERIRLRKEETIEKLQSIFETITSQELPERSCPQESYYKAKLCNYREICFHGTAPATDPWGW